MESEYLLKSNNPGDGKGADPFMIKKKNCRIVISSEYTCDSKLKDNKLKQLSGRDQVQVRPLYGNPITFTPKFKLIIQTNQIPEFDGSDEGIKRRLRIIKFRSSFVDNPTQPYEYKINRHLKTKIQQDKKYWMAFFEILLEYLYDYIENDNGNLEIPSELMEENEQLIRDNIPPPVDKTLTDPIQAFIEEVCIITGNVKDIVPAKEMCNAYEAYKKKYFSKSKNVHISTLKFKLEEKGIENHKTKNGNVYRNVKIKPLETVRQNNLVNVIDTSDIKNDKLLIKLDSIDVENINNES